MNQVDDGILHADVSLVCKLQWVAHQRPEKVFMTGDVRAIGLKSFGALGCSLFSTVTMQEVFHSVFSLREWRKRCVNTLATCFTQTISTLRLMSSGPLALLVLVLVSCHLRLLVFLVGAVVVVGGLG